MERTLLGEFEQAEELANRRTVNRHVRIARARNRIQEKLKSIVYL